MVFVFQCCTANGNGGERVGIRDIKETKDTTCHL